MKLLNVKLVLYVNTYNTNFAFKSFIIARLWGLCKNWLKYYNSSNIITGKITGKIRLTVCINDLLEMLTRVRSIEYRLGWHFWTTFCQ